MYFTEKTQNKISLICSNMYHVVSNMYHVDIAIKLVQRPQTQKMSA